MLRSSCLRGHGNTNLVFLGLVHPATIQAIRKCHGRGTARHGILNAKASTSFDIEELRILILSQDLKTLTKCG
jgi:hypothetical protein